MSYSDKLKQLRKQADGTPDWVLPTVGGITGGVGGLVFNRYVLDNKSKKSALIAGLLGAGLGVGASHILSTAGESKQDRESKADAKDRRKIQKILISNGVEPTAENVEAFKASLGSGLLGSAKLTLGALAANSALSWGTNQWWGGLDSRNTTRADINKMLRTQEVVLAEKLAKGEKIGKGKNAPVYDSKMYEKDMKKLVARRNRLINNVFERNNPLVYNKYTDKAPNWLKKLTRNKYGKAGVKGAATFVGGPVRALTLLAGIGGDVVRATTRDDRAANEIGVDKSLLSAMQDQYND